MQAIFDKWDLPCARIGVVNDDGLMRVQRGEETVVSIPARALADEAPLYRQGGGTPRAAEPPLGPRHGFQRLTRRASLLRLLSHPDHCQQALGVAAVRPHGPHRYDGRPRL